MKRWTLAFACVALGALFGTVITGSVSRAQQDKDDKARPAVSTVEAGSFRNVVKHVLPAVVSIEARAKPAQKQRLPVEGPMLPGFEDEDPNSLGSGSGFLVDPKGWVVTAYHVVDGAGEVDVILADGRRFVSKEVKTDAKTDVALVKIEAKEDLPYLEFGDSDKMEIGDRVLAVGAPFGLTGSVSQGIISAKGRSLRMNMYEDFVQTDAAINPGNSGGPLVNMEGKVVGLNAAIKSRSGGWQGVGLAVSGNMAHQVMDQLRKDGVVRRGYLGVQVKDVADKALLARLGLKEGEGGVLVTGVFDGTPAEKAGVQEGDLLTHLGDKAIRDSRELQRVVAGLPLNKAVAVKLLRDGKEKTLDVTVEEQPAKFGSARVPALAPPERVRNSETIEAAGMDVADLKGNLAELYGFREGTKGAVVVSLTRDGAASQAGMRPGMLVLKVDDAAVGSAAEVKSAFEKASLEKGVLVQARSPQAGTNFYLLRSK